MRYLLFRLSLVLSLTAGFAAAPFTAGERPPTPDPTYGLPLPAAPRAPAKQVGAQTKWIWAKRTRDTQTVGQQPPELARSGGRPAPPGAPGRRTGRRDPSLRRPGADPGP